MWIVLTRESVTAGVSGRVDKGTEKRLEMMWCQHGCHSCKEQEVYNAVRTTHCATETIDTKRLIMKIILQEKVRIHYSITIWFTNLFIFLKL